MDNAIYGLTKGQTSPTSMVGFVTKTTPKGTPDRPVNPLQLAMASGATFVARAFSGKPKELADLIVQGIDHKGFAIIDTYSPCPTFNKVNTFKYYRDQAIELPKDHNPTDVMQAWARAQSTDPVYLGVLYRSEGEASFEDHIVSAHIWHRGKRSRGHRRDFRALFVESRSREKSQVSLQSREQQRLRLVTPSLVTSRPRLRRESSRRRPPAPANRRAPRADASPACP